MAGPQPRTLRHDLETIFSDGGAIAQNDATLLEQFLSESGRPREAAFEALVRRHGPMVDRVCRRVLGDGNEAQDAFQAVFLVLARKAGSVRRGESLGSWLHGVALRVSARCRARQARTRSRERPSGGLSDLEKSGQVVGPCENGVAEIVHCEVERLTAKFRAPIVLCYLEGLTHDEAAARLKWPVGTVRSRLARGRDQLRDRLVRRGLTATGALGAMAACLGLDAEAHTIAGCSAPVRPQLSTALVARTARAACEHTTGHATTKALISTTSLTLSREVLRNMTVQKLAVLGLALLPAGMLVTAGIVVGREPFAAQPTRQDAARVSQPAQPRPAARPQPAAAPDSLEQLLPKLLQAAIDRFEAQRVYYEEGRITIDRFIASSERLMEVQKLIAKTRDEKMRALKDHVDRLKQIVDRERADLATGKGTRADEAEAIASLYRAEVELKREVEPGSEVTLLDLVKRVEALEQIQRQLEASQKFPPDSAISKPRQR